MYTFLNSLTCCRTGFRWKYRLRDQFDFVFIIFERKSKMATPMDRPKSNDVARCLNALALMNMQHIASSDILNELVSDYFVTRPIGNDDILQNFPLT